MATEAEEYAHIQVSGNASTSSWASMVGFDPILPLKMLHDCSKILDFTGNAPPARVN